MSNTVDVNYTPELGSIDSRVKSVPPTAIVLALSVVTSIPKAVIGVLEKSKNVATLLSLYASALVPSVTLKAD